MAVSVSRAVSMSHSTRVRGLKLPKRVRAERDPLVALYTSAWIEIVASIRNQRSKSVALYTSAWIEIACLSSMARARPCRTLHECVD